MDEQGWGPGLFQIRAIRDLLWTALAFVFFYLLFQLRDVFFPVLAALVLAYLSNPLISKAKSKWRWPRWLSTISLISTFFLAVIGFVVGVWPTATEQISSLNKRLPEYLQILAKRLETMGLHGWQNEIAKYVKSIDSSQDLVSVLLTKANQTLNFLANVLGGATYIGLLMALIPIFFFYFAVNFESITAKATEWIPFKSRERTLEILNKMDQQVLVFFRGRLVVSLCMCFLYSLGWLAAGVPYWFILGIGAGILNIAPYVSGIFLPAAILLKYMETLDPNATSTASFTAIILWPTVSFLIMQFIESWVLTPWIQSRDNDLSVPTVLIVIYIGGVIGGFWGLMFAIPITACTKIILNELILPKIKIWVLRH